MTIGTGKYDFPLTLALGNAEAQQGILLVLDGKKGAGFSVQGTTDAINKLPDMLEHIAAEIRKDLPGLT
jgi:hypothetical protein